MRARSKKTSDIYKLRAPLVERLLEERPYCQACRIFNVYDGVTYTPHRSVDIHELVSRGRGGSILDEDNLLAVCRFPCHSRITGDSKEAEWLGLALPSWSDEETLVDAHNRRHVAESHRPTSPPEWRPDPEYWGSPFVTT